MDKSLKTRTVALAVVLPLLLAVAAVALVADSEPTLQKLTVGATGSSAERSGANSDSAMATDLPAMAMPYRQNYVLAGPLPVLPDKAAAYRFTPGDGFAAAVELARVFQIEGEPVRQDNQWLVGRDHLLLGVDDSPGLPWFITQRTTRPGTEPLFAPDAAISGPAADGSTSVAPASPSCITPAPPEGPATPADEAPEVDPATAVDSESAQGCAYPSTPPSCPLEGFDEVSPEAKSRIEILCGGGIGFVPPEPVRPEGLPDQAEAEAIARARFAELGWSTEGLTVEDGFSAWYATAPMRIDGVEVSLYQSLSVGPNGLIVNGNGYAAGVEKLGDYPLIGADEGFKRLTEGRLQGGPVPLPATSGVADPGVTSSPATTAAVASGAPNVGSAESRPIPLPSSAEVCQISPEGTTCTVTSPSPDISVIEPEPGVKCFDAGACDPSYPPEDYVPPTIQVTGARLVLVLMDDLFVPAYVFEVGQEFGGQSPPVTAVVDDLIEVLGAP